MVGPLTEGRPASLAVLRTDAASADASEPPRGDVSIRLDTADSVTLASPTAGRSNLVGAASGALSTPLKSPLGVRARYTPNSRSHGAASIQPLVSAPLRSLPELGGTEVTQSTLPSPAVLCISSDLRRTNDPLPVPTFDDARERTFVRNGGNLPGAVNCDDDDDGVGAAAPVDRSHNIKPASRPSAAAARVDAIIADDGGWLGGPPQPQGVRAEVPMQVQEDSFLVDVELAAAAAASAALYDSVDSDAGAGLTASHVRIDNLWDLPVEPSALGARQRPLSGPPGGRVGSHARPNDLSVPSPRSRSVSSGPASLRRPGRVLPVLSPARKPASPELAASTHPYAPLQRPVRPVTQQGSPGLTPSSLQREYEYDAAADEEGLSPFLRGGSRVGSIGGAGGGPASNDGRLTRRTGARAPLGQFDDEAGGGDGASDEEVDFSSPQASPTRRRRVDGEAHIRGAAHATSERLVAVRRPLRDPSSALASAPVAGELSPSSLERDLRRQYAEAAAHYPSPPWQQALTQPAYVSRLSPSDASRAHRSSAGPDPLSSAGPVSAGPVAHHESRATSRDAHTLMAAAHTTVDGGASPREGEESAVTERSTGSAPATLVPVASCDDVTRPISSPVRHHLPNSSSFSISAGRSASGATQYLPMATEPLRQQETEYDGSAHVKVSALNIPHSAPSAPALNAPSISENLAIGVPAVVTARDHASPVDTGATAIEPTPITAPFIAPHIAPTESPSRAGSGFAVNDPAPASVAAPADAPQAAGAASSAASVSSSGDAAGRPPLQALASAHFPSAADAPAPTIAPPFSTAASSHAPVRHGALVQPSPRHATSPDGFQAAPLSGRQSGGHSSQTSAQPNAGLSFGASGGADGFLLSGALSSPRTYVSGAHGVGFTPTAFRAVPTPRKTTPRLDYGSAATGVNVGTPPLSGVPTGSSTNPAAPALVPRSLSSDSVAGIVARADVSPRVPAPDTSPASQQASTTIGNTSADTLSVRLAVEPPVAPPCAVAIAPPAEAGSLRPSITITPPTTLPAGALSAGSGHRSARSTTSGTPRNVPKLPLARLTPPVVAESVFFVADATMQAEAAVAAAAGVTVLGDATGVAETAADTALPPTTGPSPAVAPPLLQLSGRSYISSTESSSDNAGPGEGVTFPIETAVYVGKHTDASAAAVACSSAALDPLVAVQPVSAPTAASHVITAGAAVAAAAFARSAGGADAGTQTDWVDESGLETASKVQPGLVAPDNSPLALHIPAGPDDEEDSSPRPRIDVTASGGVVGPPPAALRPLRSHSQGGDDSSSPYGAALLKVHRSHSDAGDSARPSPGGTSSPYGSALLKAHRPLPPRSDEVFSPAIPESSARSRSDSRADGTSSPYGAALLKAHHPPPSREGEVFSPAIPESSSRSRSDSRADGTSSPYGNALLKAHRPAAGLADTAAPASMLNPLQRVRASSVGSIPDRADGSSSPYGSALLKAHRPLPPRPDEVLSPALPESTRSRSDSRADGTSSPYGSALLKAHRPLPSREEEVFSPAIPEAGAHSRSDSRADGTSSPYGAALLKAHHPPPSLEAEVFSPAIPEPSSRSRSDSRADGTSSPYGNALLKAHRSTTDTAPPVSMLDPVQRVRASSVGSIPDRADGSSSPYGSALLKAHRPLPPRPDEVLSPALPESTHSRSDSRADGTSSPYGSALLKAHRPLPSREDEVFSPAIPESSARSRSDSRADGTSSPYGNALLKAHRPADAPSSEVSPANSDSRSRVRSDDGTSSPYGAALLKAHRPRSDSDLSSPLPLLPAIARVRSESFGDGGSGSSPVGSALLKAHRQGPPTAPSGAIQQAPAGPAGDSADSSSPGSASVLIAEGGVSVVADADLPLQPAPPSSNGCDMPFPAGAADGFAPTDSSRPASDGDGDAGHWAGTPPSDLGAPEDGEMLLHGRGSTVEPPVAAAAPSPMVPESPCPFTQAGGEGSLGPVPHMSLAATGQQQRQHGGGGGGGTAPPLAGSGAGFGSALASAAAAAALLAAAAPSPAAASDAGWAGGDLVEGDPDADPAAAAAAAAHAAGVLGSGSASVASHFSVGSIGAPATLPAASGDYGGGLQSAAPASALGGASEFGLDSSVGGPRSLATGHGSSSSSAGGGSSSTSGSTSGVGTPSTRAGLLSTSTVAGGTGAGGGMVQTPPASGGGSAIASPPPIPSGAAVRLDTMGVEEVPSSMASPALRAVVRELHGAELRSWQLQQQQQEREGAAVGGVPSRSAAAFPYSSRSGGPAEPTALPPIPEHIHEHGSPAESSPSAAAASPQFDCSSSSPQGNVLLALKMRRAAKEGAAGLCEEEEAGDAVGPPAAPLPSALTATSPRSHFAPDFYPAPTATAAAATAAAATAAAAASAAAPAPVRAAEPPVPQLPPPQLQAPPLPRTTAWAAAAAPLPAAPPPDAAPAPAPAPVTASPPAPAPASVLASPPSVGPYASPSSAAAVPLLVISPSSLGQLGGIAAAFPASARSTARRSITRSHPPSPLSRVPVAKAAPGSLSSRPPMGGGGLGTGRSSSGAAPVNRRIGLMRSDSMGSEIQVRKGRGGEAAHVACLKRTRRKPTYFPNCCAGHVPSTARRALVHWRLGRWLGGGRRRRRGSGGW